MWVGLVGFDRLFRASRVWLLFEWWCSVGPVGSVSTPGFISGI